MSGQHNLLWLDLEMTGLNQTSDVILEIACAITNNELELLAQGPSLIIHQDDIVLSGMHEKVRELHTKSGLLAAVRSSSISCKQAEEQVVIFLRKYASAHNLLLAGNTIWQDRGFLIRYMPSIMEYLHYRMIDVSSIKELVRRWYPHNPHAHVKKTENHRALEDVFASIQELKHYRTHFFIPR